jgi:hypothetical protein
VGVTSAFLFVLLLRLPNGQDDKEGDMKSTREDVIACYSHILGREPENEETLSRLVGRDFWQLVEMFAHSDEHRANVSAVSAHSLLKYKRDNYLS